MNATLKKILIGVGAVIAALALVFGIMTVVRNVSRGAVHVYPVSMLGMFGYEDWNSTTYGTVSSEGIQNVYTSETRKVTEVLVTEGQQVHAGDPLLTYDTSLTELDLMKAELEVNKLELQRREAEAELAQLRAMKPRRIVTVTQGEDPTYTPTATPALIAGKGSEAEPFIVLWGAEDQLTMSYAKWLVDMRGGSAALAPDADDTAVYVAFITREGDAMNAPITGRFGVGILSDATGVTGFNFFNPTIPPEIEAYDPGQQSWQEIVGSMYTASELAQLRTAKEQEIKELDIKLGMAKIAYQRTLEETGDGTIYATIDGAVRAVRSPEEALQTGMPVVEVSAGGGYYVTGSMGEFDRVNNPVGARVMVTVYDWTNGGAGMYEGTIVSLSDYPLTDNGEYYYDGATTSRYAFTVFIDGSAVISDNAYVEINYGSSATDGGGMYLENPFIRTEGGKSYVYVEGPDGKLERREVKVGVDLWGSYTQILGGLSMDDYVAFPYGKDVVPGAKTVEDDTLESLYSGMY